jgi:hypothetical protein
MICAYCDTFKVHSFYRPGYCSKTCLDLAMLRRKKEALAAIEKDELDLAREWKARCAAAHPGPHTVTASGHFGQFAWTITAVVDGKVAADLAWEGLLVVQARQAAARMRSFQKELAAEKRKAGK